MSRSPSTETGAWTVPHFTDHPDGNEGHTADPAAVILCDDFWYCGPSPSRPRLMVSVRHELAALDLDVPIFDMKTLRTEWFLSPQRRKGIMGDPWNHPFR